MTKTKNDIVEGDVTHLIERLEVFEERMGVRLDALFAKLEEGYLTVNFELHSRDGNQIKEDTKVVIAVYDSAGRLVARGINQSYAAVFFGFEAFSETIRVPGQIAKIRVMPKHPQG